MPPSSLCKSTTMESIQRRNFTYIFSFFYISSSYGNGSLVVWSKALQLLARAVDLNYGFMRVVHSLNLTSIFLFFSFFFKN